MLKKFVGNKFTLPHLKGRPLPFRLFLLLLFSLLLVGITGAENKENLVNQTVAKTVGSRAGLSINPPANARFIPPKSAFGGIIDYTASGWPIVADELIVKFKSDVPENKKAAILDQKGARTENISTFNGVRLIKINPSEREKIRQELASNPSVEYVQPNQIAESAQAPRLVPNDYNSNYQWNLEKTQAPEGWYINQGSSSKTIAIVDTGVDYNHPDLSSKVIKGHDFIQDDEDPMDEYGHGTLVAGVAAAATNNAQGIAGVAWQPKILAIRVFQDRVGTVYNMTLGMLQASISGADVINLSLSFGDHDDFFFQALANVVINQGKIVVGGPGDFERNDTTCQMGYPSSYNLVIAVNATDVNDRFVLGCRNPSWAPPGYGREFSGVDIAAPGADLPSTRLGGGYEQAWGTSVAIPHVAGAAATMLSCNSDADIVKHALISTADDIETPGYDLESGWGRLNLYKALLAVCNPNPQISLKASPNPTFGSPVNVHVKVNDPNSDLAGVYYYNDSKMPKGSWAIPGLTPGCNTSTCEFYETLSSFPQTNWKYKLSVTAYDNAGHKGVFCVYGCPDNDNVLGNNNYLELTVGSGLGSSGLTNSDKTPPSYLGQLTTSSGSVIINLNWTDTYGEVGYIIQKGLGALPTFADLPEVGAGVTEYHDHLPVSQEGSTITYRIRAKFPDNSTSLSNQQTINAPIVTPSAFPVEVNTVCNDSKVKVSLSWGALAQGTNYKIYFKYKNSSDQLLTTLYAPDAYAGYQLKYNWETTWGNLASNDLVVHIVAQTPGGSIDSSHVSVVATDCQSSPPPTPLDPPGAGTLTVTKSCSTWHPWANADWNPRRGYTGQYKAQYKLTSQSAWTDSLSGNVSETWDMIYLTNNGNYNFRVITTADNQVWANPITVSINCETPTGSLQVSYRCTNGEPVADLSWTAAPSSGLQFYDIEYLRPGQSNWQYGHSAGRYDTFLSTEDYWGITADPLASGETWGWNIKAKYSSYQQWAGPVYKGPIPYCPPSAPQTAAMHKSPSAVANNTSGPSGANRSWDNPSYARTSDNNHAYVFFDSSIPAVRSYYLQSTNFGFSVPSDAIINGIRVVVEKNKGQTDAITVKDYSVRLVKGGSVVGSNKADTSTNWPLLNNSYNKAYGGPTDLWGTSWIPADINNNSNFGLAFSAKADQPAPHNDGIINVDYIMITVYYTVPISLPSPCNSFADVNSDGKVNQTDLNMISNQSSTFNDEQKRRADVNGDGVITQTDIDKITAYLDGAVYTFPVCEDPDNDGLPNYEDMDDDGNGAIDPPTVSITLNTATVTAGEPFTITVTGTSPIGIGFIWWFGQNTGVADAAVTINYPASPTSSSMACSDVINPTKLDRTFCSPVFSDEQKVTLYSFTSTVIINQPGIYQFRANARDVLYPIPGEAHQASEGAGIQVVEVQNLPPSLGEIGSQSVIEGQSLNITLSATDPDNDSLTYSVANPPQGTSLNGQTFSWTPSYEQSGTYDVTFTASDGKLTDSKPSKVTVLNDQDKDGFADSIEIFIGTDPHDACPDNKWDSCWPPDFNNDRIINTRDMNILKSKITNGLGYSKYNRRYDLNADGKIDILDISILLSYIGKTCR